MNKQRQSHPRKWKNGKRRLHLLIDPDSYIKLKKVLKAKDLTMQETWENYYNEQINK